MIKLRYVNNYCSTQYNYIVICQNRKVQWFDVLLLDSFVPSKDTN